MSENQNTSVVEMSKNFGVPVERLFEAWNEPEQLKQWWHPLNNHLESVTNELKEGGNIEYAFHDHKLHITGNYQQVSKNEKLVYTWNWELADDQLKNAEYTLSIDFIPAENGSRLQIRQEGFKDQQATQPHEEGWNQGLASLQDFLQKNLTDGNSGPASSKSKDQPVTAGDAPDADRPPVIASAYDQASGSDDSAAPNQSFENKSGDPDSGDHTENQPAQAVSQPGTNTENPTRENFDPSQPGNSVSPEY